MSVTLSGQSKVFQARESDFPQLTLHLKTVFSRTQAGTMRTIGRATPDYTIALNLNLMSLQQRQDLAAFINANAGKLFTYWDDTNSEKWSVRLITDPATITLADRSLNTVQLSLQGTRV